MGKSAKIEEVVNRLAVALRHRIGALLGTNKDYAKRYLYDSIELINQAREIVIDLHLNVEDKQELKIKLSHKLQKELEVKEFIPEKKFQIMNSEIDKVLRELGILY